MNRLPLLLSLVALVIAVAALVLAITLPGPQGIQGVQGPPSSLSVQRQAIWLSVSNMGEWATNWCRIDLNAGDVLQGYITGAHTDVRYGATLLTRPGGPGIELGSGYGGTPVYFCYASNATGTYDIIINLGPWSSIPQYAPWEEYVPVVYWVQAGNTTQAG